MPDSEIVASIVTGDPDGLAAAYDRHADALYKYCRSVLGGPQAADAVQDTFLIAASRLAELGDPRRLRPWLYAVARNECMRILRSRKNTPALWETPGEADTVIDITEGAAERARLRALLATAAPGLDPDEREVLELLLRQGLEPGEAAAVLGVSSSRAHVLASRAHDQLEACLAVLLIGGAGGGACRELDAMLADWDGQLTVELRKRVHPHIERCPTCGTRLALELGPPVLLGMPAGAAMAAAAAESFWLAPGAPDELRGHTLLLATDQDPGAIAHRSAAASRAGTLGRDGFPEARRHPGVMAGLPWAAPAQAAMAGLRSTPRARAVVATAVAVGIAIAATAFALSGGTGSASLAGRRPPAGQVAGPAAGKAATSAGPKPTASATRPTAHARPPATRQPATSAAPSPAPTASAPPTPAPVARGTVTMSVGHSGPVQPGTPLTLGQDGGTSITLTAIGGPVIWSVSVSGGPPGHQVAVSGPSSGTLQPGQSAQILLTAYKSVHGATLTINPGGAAYPLVADSQDQ